MYKRGSNINSISHSGLIKAAVCICLIFFSASLLHAKNYFGKDDSTKVFPLNDPRNPNCPCHKYQQLAEQEFQNQLQQNQVVVQQNNNMVQIQQNTGDQKKVQDKGKQNQILVQQINPPIQIQQEFGNDEEEINESASTTQVYSGSGYTGSSKRTKHKRLMKKFHYYKRRLDLGRIKFWKGWRDISACYSWQ